MAFDPLLFLQIASSLANEPTGEAKLRTAVGRAYYAIFLLARDRAGVRGKKEVHKRVLKEVNKKLGKPVRDQLDDLRKLRGKADYELSAVVDSHDWRRADSLAQHLLPRINKL